MKLYQFVFVLIALGWSVVACQKDDLVTDVPHNQDPDIGWGVGDSVPIVSKYWFRGKIDSVLYTFQDSIDGYVNLVGDSVYISCDHPDDATDTLAGFYGQRTGMYSSNGKKSLEIKILKCIPDTGDTVVQKSMLFAGTYPYGDSYFLNAIDGVEITWVDAAGKVWKSNPGSGNMGDHSFRIINIMPADTGSLGDTVIIGVMNLELYNLTDYVTVEGAEFQLQYGVYE